MMKIERNEHGFQLGKRRAGADIVQTELRQPDAPHLHFVFQIGDRVRAVVPDARQRMRRIDAARVRIGDKKHPVANALDDDFFEFRRFVRARRTELALSKVRLRDGLRDRREILQESADLLDAVFTQRGLEGDRLIAAVDLYQALGGGFAGGPGPEYPKPAPENDPITPVVEGIQSLTGG